MATDKQSKENAKDDKQKQILDFADAWKKMYFESEATLAKAIDEYVAGDSFTSFLEKMGAEYLSWYKTSNQNLERFYANSPMPTKKDIARVAELAINIEEKVENLDMDISAGLNNLAATIMKLLDFQAVLRDEVISLRLEVRSIQEQLKAGRPVAGAAGEEKPLVRSRSKKTTGGDAPESAGASENGKEPPPKRRKKQTD